MIMNPIITPPVTDDRAFATRAILGEKQWIADPMKRRDVIALNAVSTACLSVAGITAWRRPPTAHGHRRRRIDGGHSDDLAQLR
jgi:hypothetical protein